jgi:hypothetical protein
MNCNSKFFIAFLHSLSPSLYHSFTIPAFVVIMSLTQARGSNSDFELLPRSHGSSNNENSCIDPRISLLEVGNEEDKVSNVSSMPSSTGKRPSILHNFFWEIFCSILATTSLLTFVAILWKHDNQESPEWSLGHVTVTLNTIISIVSTVFRSSLLVPVAQSISQLCWIQYRQPRSLHDICYYDSASRGPLGSIRLLFRLRFMYVTVFNI